MIKELKDKTWGEYQLNDLFEVTGTKTTPLNELQTKNETMFPYPYITTKSNFMGVDGFYKYYTEEENVIVIDSATNGHVHYQWTKFSASDHVEKLIPKFKMNKYTGFFIVASIKSATNNKFNYGYKFSQARIKKQKIQLPTNSKGVPDFEFMENYMRNIEKKLINKYNEFINEKINKLEISVEEKGGGEKIETLCNKKWGVFVLSEIFEIKSTSSGIDKNKLINKKGRIPYITRTDENNGITDFIDKQSEKYIINECNVITIGLDTQTAFYQGNKFYTGQNIQIIYNKQLNKYNALFLIHLLKKLMEKFNWGGNGATLNRLNKSKILLPLDSKKTPDWNFMEKYMKNLEYKKINKYLDYIKNRI